VVERILVALDGSPYAEQSLPFAVALARAFEEVEIVLLRVVDTRSGPTTLDSFDWRMDRTEAYEYLSDIKSRLKDEGVSVDIDVSSGRASEEILAVAGARDVDLVMVASHGTSGLSQFHMASTAQKVVFGCETSVLVVPAREVVDPGPPFTSVVVPVDGSARGEWAFSVAARLARPADADLVVVHVVREPTLVDPQGTERERQLVDELVAINQRAAVRYLDGLKRRLGADSPRVRAQVEVAADIAPVLERWARGEEHPLVVLSACGEFRHEDVPFGSLVTVMLTNSEHPVLVLREGVRANGTSAWPGEIADANPSRAVGTR
jgi:nucleotide-binding universal stress UspA family protein